MTMPPEGNDIGYADRMRSSWNDRSVDKVDDSIGHYLMRSGFTIDQLMQEEGNTLRAAARFALLQVLDNDPLSIPNELRYMQDRKASIDIQLSNMVKNSLYLRSIMGQGFFQRRPGRSEPRTHFTSPLLDGKMWLGIKGGSGAGSFSLDVAIGIPKRGDFRHVNGGEMWRVGVDTIKNDDETTCRVIKLGSAMSKNKTGYAQKKLIAEQFRDNYGISIPRSMAALALLVAHSLPGCSKLSLISEATFTRPEFTGYSRQHIKFNYSNHFANLGFSNTQDHNGIMTFSNDPDVFYTNLLDIERNGQGIHCGELAGFGCIVGAFNSAADALSDKTNPLQLPPDSSEDLLAHMIAARSM